MKKQNIKLYISSVNGTTMNIDLQFKPKYLKVLNMTQAINSNDNAYEFYWVYSDLCNGSLGYATYESVGSSELIPLSDFVNGTYKFWLTNVLGGTYATNATMNGAIVAILEFSTD